MDTAMARGRLLLALVPLVWACRSQPEPEFNKLPHPGPEDVLRAVEIALIQQLPTPPLPSGGAGTAAAVALPAGPAFIVQVDSSDPKLPARPDCTWEGNHFGVSSHWRGRLHTFPTQHVWRRASDGRPSAVATADWQPAAHARETAWATVTCVRPGYALVDVQTPGRGDAVQLKQVDGAWLLDQYIEGWSQ